MIDTDHLVDAVDRFLHNVPNTDFVDQDKWKYWTDIFHAIIYVDGKQGPALARERMRLRDSDKMLKVRDLPPVIQNMIAEHLLRSAQ